MLFDVYECLPIFMFVCHMCGGTHRGQKRAPDPESGVNYGCEPTCGCWEPNSDPLQMSALKP